MNAFLSRAVLCLTMAATVGCQSGPRFRSTLASLNPFARDADPVARLNEPSSLAGYSDVEATPAVYPRSESLASLAGIHPASSRGETTGGEFDYLLERARSAVHASPPRPGEAIDLYNQALAVAPGNAVARHELAILCDNEAERFERLNDRAGATRYYAMAEENYLAALRVHPNDPNLLNSLGYSYLMQGRYAESERNLQRAIDVDPSHVKAASNLGLLHGKLGNYDQSLAWLRRVGSEEQVQARMRDLFPSGPPVGNAGVPAQFASASNPAAGSTPPSDATRQLLDEMRRARLQGETARDERNQQQNAFAFSANPQPRPESPPPAAGTGRVSDSELSRLFAEIDRPGAGSYQAAPQHNAAIPQTQPNNNTAVHRPQPAPNVSGGFAAGSQAVTNRNPTEQTPPPVPWGPAGQGTINPSAPVANQGSMNVPHQFASESHAQQQFNNAGLHPDGNSAASGPGPQNLHQPTFNSSDNSIPLWQHAPATGRHPNTGLPTLPAAPTVPNTSTGIQVTPQAPAPGFPPQAAAGAETARQAQIAGLNAGPGSLFPIASSSRQSTATPASWSGSPDQVVGRVTPASGTAFPPPTRNLPGSSVPPMGWAPQTPSGAPSLPQADPSANSSGTIPVGSPFGASTPPSGLGELTPIPPTTGLSAAPIPPNVPLNPPATPAGFGTPAAAQYPAGLPVNSGLTLQPPVNPNQAPATNAYNTRFGPNQMPPANPPTATPDPMDIYEAQIQQHNNFYGNALQQVRARRGAVPATQESTSTVQNPGLPQITPGLASPAAATAVYPE